jgi:iron complex transport system permease protein
VTENRENIAAASFRKTGGNARLWFLFITLLVIAAFLLDIMLGSVKISLPDFFHALFNGSDKQQAAIILKFRLPKAVTAALAGIALAVSGLQMQTVFRNPLAGPYVLGVSSGASLGVAFVILGFHGSVSPEGLKWFGNWALAAASWIGAGAVMLLIMFISMRVRDIMTVLILGILLSGGISSVVSIMQYFSNETMLKAYVVWTMGSLGNLTGGQIGVLSASVLIGLVLSLGSVKMLNAMLLGENYASSLGLNVLLARALIFTGTSILAGSVTAFCGPIGFIGIAVPHISKIIFRTADHRILLPSTVLIGCLIMLVSDILSQLPGSGLVIPINSVASLVGIPIVIWVIFRNKRYSGAV